ncbi:MAG: coenzyme F420-0:L-glutamate ligase [Candidatus Peribacteraceae bacterium]|nr:coenzyme F420-0:L-glutamate ligase [Candidatus Peribacteraceae bacterium]
MEILPLRTPTLKRDDDLAKILAHAGSFMDGDIVVVSSKAVATVEGAEIDLRALKPSPEAEKWAARCGRPPAFREAILRETERLHGTVLGSCTQAMLTELKPKGFGEGTILAANAGLDQSNVPEGFAIGWPHDPVASVRHLRGELVRLTGRRLALILSDSCCRPRRLGVTALALVVSGIDPIRSLVGSRDLFARELTMTSEAVADQLATAANFVMGNAAEATPAALIRNHGLSLTDFEGWVQGIERERDLFAGALSP